MTTPTPRRAHIIVLGNEKGGTGKSTTAMHIVTSLLQRDARVAIIDLDSRQQSLNRFLDNRRTYAANHNVQLDQPDAFTLARSPLRNLDEAERDERERLNSLLGELHREYNFVVIDCPGSDSQLSRLAQSHADTLVTPLNDSFVDVDLIGQIDAQTYRVQRLSLYSESVWESRKQRALAGRRSLDWVVLRNRVASMHAHNKRRVDEALKQLQQRIVFRYVPGLSERVIYRELFPQGLTLVDYKHLHNRPKLTLSQLAARQEIRRLMENLRLPELKELQPPPGDQEPARGPRTDVL